MERGSGQRGIKFGLLAGGYLISSPLSAAGGLPWVSSLKYVRTSMTLALLGLGLLYSWRLKIRGASVALIAFVAMYVTAALWSALPGQALLYKGLFGLTVVSGMAAGYSNVSREDIRNIARLAVVASIVFAVIAGWGVLRNTATFNFTGRLLVWDLNPNRAGRAAAAMSSMCVYLLLYDDKTFWRLAGAAVATVLVAIILLTGSRGAAGMALIAASCIAAPTARRPLLAVVTIVALVVIGLVAFTIVEERAGRAVDRFSDTSVENRSDVWSYGWRRFEEYPLLGHGWIYQMNTREGGSTKNLHSIYLQVLAETGLAGALAFACVLVVLLVSCGRVLLDLVARKTRAPPAFLGVGLVTATLATGVVESATIVGSTVTSMLLGLGVALVQRYCDGHRWGWSAPGGASAMRSDGLRPAPGGRSPSPSARLP